MTALVHVKDTPDTTGAVLEAVYQLDGSRVLTSPHAAGPWSTTTQHGAAPAGLIAWAVDQIEAAQPMQVARLTIDLLRPVPLAPLSIVTDIVREGRKIQVSTVRLMAEGVEVARASALRVRIEPMALPDANMEEPLGLPGPDAGVDPGHVGALASPFLSGVAMRHVKGDFRTPGAAAVWYRVDRPLIASAAISPLMRAAITSDFSNGTSAVLDPTSWTFINGDLTVSLARQPIGDWILLDALSWIGPAGAGIASARLGDTRGWFGRAVQSLVIERRDGSRSDQTRTRHVR
ncbi:MAG: thioesterase family protein [Methylocella sp.]